MNKLSTGLLGLVLVLHSEALGALQLDRTFGDRGIVTTYVEGAGLSLLAIQHDGRILAAGSSSDGIVLARYLKNGALDPTFGSGGIATSFPPPSSFIVSAMALQGDGRILVAGTIYDGGAYRFFVARLLPNGDPDLSFGIGGLVTNDFASAAAGAQALALQPDGKIVVAGGAGTLGPFPDSDFAAARYDTDGILDASFGTGGRVLIDMGGSTAETAHALVVESDGRIVLGGDSYQSAGNGFALAGLLADGSPDPDFGVGGKVFLSLGAWSACSALALQRDGKIVAGGTVSLPDGLLAVRVTSDGSLDPSFGSGGIATIPIPGQTSALALDPEGRIVLAGSAHADFLLARLLPGGQPDPEVGPEGWTHPGLGGSPPHFQAQATSVAVQSDGAILLGGSQSVVVLSFFTLVRYAGAAQTIPLLSRGVLLLVAALLGAAGVVALARAT